MDSYQPPTSERDKTGWSATPWVLAGILAGMVMRRSPVARLAALAGTGVLAWRSYKRSKSQLPSEAPLAISYSSLNEYPSPSRIVLEDDCDGIGETLKVEEEEDDLDLSNAKPAAFIQVIPSAWEEALAPVQALREELGTPAVAEPSALQVLPPEPEPSKPSFVPSPEATSSRPFSKPLQPIAGFQPFNLASLGLTPVAEPEAKPEPLAVLAAEPEPVLPEAEVILSEEAPVTSAPIETAAIAEQVMAVTVAADSPAAELPVLPEAPTLLETIAEQSDEPVVADLALPEILAADFEPETLGHGAAWLLGVAPAPRVMEADPLEDRPSAMPERPATSPFKAVTGTIVHQSDGGDLPDVIELPATPANEVSPVASGPAPLSPLDMLVQAVDRAIAVRMETGPIPLPAVDASHRKPTTHPVLDRILETPSPVAASGPRAASVPMPPPTPVAAAQMPVPRTSSLVRPAIPRPRSWVEAELEQKQQTAALAPASVEMAAELPSKEPLSTIKNPPSPNAAPSSRRMVPKAPASAPIASETKKAWLNWWK